MANHSSDSPATKIDDEITYHKDMEDMAVRAGDFTKAEHHRRMQEIFAAIKEKQFCNTSKQISDGDYKVSPINIDYSNLTENRSFPDWRSLYTDEAQVEKLPWFSKELDPDLRQELKNRKIKSGKFLDLGTGPATQAIQLSKLGFDVTATDISESAISRGKKLSNEVEFVLDDILDSTLQDNQFDYIFDRGCFHTLKPPDRPRYVLKVRSLLTTGGFLFLKTFSIKEPITFGPYRFSVEMIEETFSTRFEILSSTDTVFQGTLDVLPKALFIVLRKKY